MNNYRDDEREGDRDIRHQSYNDDDTQVIGSDGAPRQEANAGNPGGHPHTPSGSPRPRQYFPGEYDPNHPPQPNYPPQPGGAGGMGQQGASAGYYPGQSGQPGQAEYYAGPAGPPPGYDNSGYSEGYDDRDTGNSGGSGSGWAVALGVIAAFALVAAGALFFLWRSAAQEANRPAPEPVTQTATVTEQVPTTVTETATVTETQQATPTQQDRPDMEDIFPTGLPEPSLPNNADSNDIESWLNGLLEGTQDTNNQNQN